VLVGFCLRNLHVFKVEIVHIAKKTQRKNTNENEEA
jgi:hypothetical protein